MTDGGRANVLVDTSVWIDHLRGGLPLLQRLLGAERVLMHPMVLGEIACGKLADRKRVLDALAALPRVPAASADDVMHLVEACKLHGRGVGLIDVHLLASTLLVPGAVLWTMDRRLASVARELSIVAEQDPELH